MSEHQQDLQGHRVQHANRTLGHLDAYRLEIKMIFFPKILEILNSLGELFQTKTKRSWEVFRQLIKDFAPQSI